jgi:osmotically-inducible protein OsmY
MKQIVMVSVLGIALAQLTGCAAIVVGGAAAGAAAGVDRRTAGTVVSDQEIELRALDRLRKSFPQAGFSVSATSYNRQVLLTGQVYDQATHDKLVDEVKGIPDVRNVINETTVSGVTSITSSGNDAALTTKVKARMLENKQVPSYQVKVVTEAGVVYLMGLMKHAEADAAAEVASTTGGVLRVVKLFEYLD